MKSIASIIILSLGLIACQSSSKEEQTEAKPTVEKTKIYKAEDLVKGEFIYVDSVAVLKGTDFIYGVVLDEKAEELIEKTNELKTDQYDMFPVIVTGKLTKKESKDTWEDWLVIDQIVEVKPPSNNQIQLQTK